MGGSSGQIFRGLVTAVRTLSILPVPGRDSESLSSALPWFPVIGALLGWILYGFRYIFTSQLRMDLPEVSAWIVVVGGIILTRGMHLDGLADMADSFGSISDRKRMLEIMKDSRTGAFGVLALVSVLLGKWTALVQLFRCGGGIWIIAAYVVSRYMMVILAVSMPYARVEEGTARGFVSDAKFVHLVLAVLFTVVLLAGIPVQIGVISLISGCIVCLAYRFWCLKRFGGITGDLLGAGSEITELLVLLAGSILMSQPGMLGIFR